MDISVTSNFIVVKKTTDDFYGKPFIKGYPVSKIEEFDFSSKMASITINNTIYELPFSDLTIQGIAPTDYDEAAQKMSDILIPSTSYSAVGNNVDGTFTSVDNKTITVENGFVTAIEETPPEV